MRSETFTHAHTHTHEHRTYKHKCIHAETTGVETEETAIESEICGAAAVSTSPTVHFHEELDGTFGCA